MRFEMPSEVRDGHPYFMYDEMSAQPAALRDAAAAGREAAPALKDLFSREVVYLTGCGTSFHAALTCEYWLRALGVAPAARAVEAFELSTGAYAFGSGTVLAFSQSGGKGATLAATARANSAGATTVAVTGHSDSDLAPAAGHVLWTRYASERSWAHTISYTTSLMAFLSALSVDDAELSEHIDRLPDAVEARLRDEAEIREIANRVAGGRRVYILGSGANYGTALEAALKLRETSYCHADAMNAEYFLHGPVSSLDPGSVLVAVAPPDATRGRALDVLRAARTIGAQTVALGEIGDSELEEVADEFIDMAPLREELTPLLYVVPLHLFSYWLAVGSGLNPDLIRRDQESYRLAREGYEL
jgi:glutamine---fructose-6-phosphate transaminase (isomerizing)